jgi:hypothetical protein
LRIERIGNPKPITPRFVRFLVEGLGGQSLDELQAPAERRIDYRCLRGLVAIELKTLEQDASERMLNVTADLMKRPDWPEFYGLWPMESVLKNLGHNADNVRQNLEERAGRAIVNHLKKANKQLYAHCYKYPRKNVVRLAVLINEDHELYDPVFTTNVIKKEI